MRCDAQVEKAGRVVERSRELRMRVQNRIAGLARLQTQLAKDSSQVPGSDGTARFPSGVPVVFLLCKLHHVELATVLAAASWHLHFRFQMFIRVDHCRAQLA